MGQHIDYWQSGYKVFGLYGRGQATLCECGDKNCDQPFKHPRISNWQNVVHWSEEQLLNLEKAGHFKTGFGVLVDGFVVVDVDPRNGGTVPDGMLSMGGFVVETGGGGWHIYFKAPDNVPLMTKHTKFPGIDFKSSGYVVGAGSMHASGTAYDHVSGDLENLPPLPDEYVELLRKPDSYRTHEDSGRVVDVTENQILDMLSHINPDLHYDDWIRIGMAVHEVSQGALLSVWDDWSAHGEKYPGPQKLQHHWHSFGKAANPVTIGTLIYHAEQNGWKAPVTFTPPATVAAAPKQPALFDMTRPPGFVGDIASWIRRGAIAQRERISAAVAINSVGNIIGRNYTDVGYNTVPNSLMFCVADASTGKEWQGQAMFRIHQAAGLAPCVHSGSIKSEQELMRNFIENPKAIYNIDEIGLFMGKIANAKKSGSAPYLEGIPGLIMSAYTKGGDFLGLGGDQKRDLREILQRKISALQKMKDENRLKDTEELDDAIAAMADVENGIRNPFISVVGYTTLKTFESIVTLENVTNGLFSRAMIIQERSENPAWCKPSRDDLPMPMQLQLASMTGGDVRTTPEAAQRIQELSQYYWDKGEALLGTGLVPIPRRAWEMVLKFSMILAAPSGLRTLEHVEWCKQFVDADIDNKIRLVQIDTADTAEAELKARIASYLAEDEGVTLAVLKNKARSKKFRQEDIEKCVSVMLQSGALIEKKTTRSSKLFLS